MSGVKPSGVKKNVVLSDGSSFTVNRYACIGKGDRVQLTGLGRSKEIDVVCANGTARITGTFESVTTATILCSRLRIKEIDQPSEIVGYELLTRYHYRSEASFGRRSLLVARTSGLSESRVIGYIEITNTFAGHKARNHLLRGKFASEHIEWNSWDVEERNKYINAIARISRCVVHPEFRGCGIGVALCKAAIRYCKERWQIAGLKPIFLEITADMLKFVPFAERAGMSFIGTTSGNAARLLKDQRYLQGVKAAIDSGSRSRSSHSVFSTNAKSILQRQRRDAESLLALNNGEGTSVVKALEHFVDAETPSDVSPTAYRKLRDFIRFPKPTYMIGLTDEAQRFLKRRLTEVKPKGKPEPIDFSIDPIDEAFVLDHATVSFTASVPNTTWANSIQEAFGFHTDSLVYTGISDLSVQIQPRELLYIVGSSGSGKTSLLRLIEGEISTSTGRCSRPVSARIGVLNLDFNAPTVLEELDVTRLDQSLFVLGLTGLAEAHVYLKNPKYLSGGQQYRLALAKLMLSRSNVWIIDEFCSTLDDWTAQLVASNVHKYVRRNAVTAIVAGTREGSVIGALKPDCILRLDALGTWQAERS